MPVHDWTRVVAGVFHDFHTTWIPVLKNTLNAGVLPAGYYALAEQIAEGPRPDVIALESMETAGPEPFDLTGTGALAVAEHPPRVTYTEEAEREIYAHAANRVAIYHSSNDRVVAYLEVVSSGNKHSRLELDRFLEKLDEAVERCCHLLILDLFPPGKWDPRGLHAAFWERRHGEAHGVTTERPLGLSAYRIEIESESLVVPHAYFEPVALGQELPDMPLFLTPDHYINVPLERTYLEAWQGVPKRWRDVIDPPTAAAS